LGMETYTATINTFFSKEAFRNDGDLWKGITCIYDKTPIILLRVSIRKTRFLI
jgi:hypothetical protein